jgi:hypothetical protein
MNLSLGTFMTDLSPAVQMVFDALLPVVYLLLGLLLAFWVVDYVIDTLADVGYIKRNHRIQYDNEIDDETYSGIIEQ